MDALDPSYRSIVLGLADLVQLRLPHPQRQLHPDAQGQSVVETGFSDVANRFRHSTLSPSS